VSTPSKEKTLSLPFDTHVDRVCTTAYTVPHPRRDCQQWWLVNDSQVVRVDAEEALSQSAYVLLYECGSKGICVARIIDYIFSLQSINV